jgi:hypothetical protein
MTGKLPLKHEAWSMLQLNSALLDYFRNVIAHAQKPDFVFRRNGRVHLNRRGRQFSWLLAAEVYVSAVVMLDTPCSEVVWKVLATHSISQFPLHFPSRASPCSITFQLDSTPFDLSVIIFSSSTPFTSFRCRLRVSGYSDQGLISICCIYTSVLYLFVYDMFYGAYHRLYKSNDDMMNK